MNIQFYNDIHDELVITKKELMERLHFLEGQRENDHKQITLLHEIVNELEDVNRALNKMQVGRYGISEDTGRVFSVSELQMMPTARFESDIPFFLRG